MTQLLVVPHRQRTTPRHRRCFRRPTVQPLAALTLHPTGDGSCRHLNKEVQRPGSIALNSGVFEVGREAPADIVVPVPTVSGHHAMLRIDGQRVNVTDLNSTNGTYVGGKQLEPMSAIDLQLGDEMTFGDMYLAKFELRDE